MAHTVPVMVLQHGFSRHSRFWYNWVPLLGAEFRILRPDMRGMGRSTMAEERYVPLLAMFADDVQRLLNHLGIAQIVYVGESFGGIIGLQFAHLADGGCTPGRHLCLALTPRVFLRLTLEDEGDTLTSSP